MARRPSSLSQTPIANRRGDVLGDVMSLGLLREAMYRQLDARAPWGLAVPAQPDRALLYVVARGRARLELAGRDALVLEAGAAAFLPRGAAHVLRDSPTTRPSMTCDRAAVRAGPARPIGRTGAPTSILAAFFELARRAPLLLGPPAEVVTLSAADPGAGATISLLLAELAQPGPASALLVQRLADVLVVQAMRSLANAAGCSANRRPGLVALSDPPIHEALSLLHAQVDRAWSVAELAARVGLSRSGFAARFGALVGEPPLRYLARWRVARAAELLRGGNDPVGEIAARVGYASTPSFNKAFKRWQGVSPVAYRRRA